MPPLTAKIFEMTRKSPLIEPVPAPIRLLIHRDPPPTRTIRDGAAEAAPPATGGESVLPLPDHPRRRAHAVE